VSIYGRNGLHLSLFTDLEETMPEWIDALLGEFIRCEVHELRFEKRAKCGTELDGRS